MDVDFDDSEEDEAQRSQELSDDDPDWDPFEGKNKGKKKGRGSSRGRSAAASGDEEDEDGVMSEGGYSTGYSTGEDEDSGGEEMFGQDALDPLALLEDMEREAGEAGDLGARQPYQVFRAQRRAAVRAQRLAANDQTDPSTDAGTDEYDSIVDSDADGRSAGNSSSRPARGGSSGRGKGKGAFGADFEDIIDEDDPLAAQLGLVKMKGKGRGRRGGRGRGKGKGRGRRRRKPRKGLLNVLPEEAAKQLGHANLMYATGRFKEAINLLMHVIKVFPNSAEPYHTLGLLHEALGNGRKALDFYMIAAHLTAKDVTLWKRLAALSTEIGFFRQAVYCLSKAIAHDAKDADARWDRAVLYAELGEQAKAIRQFQVVGKIRPGDGEVPKMLARMYHRAGEPLKAIAELEQHIEKNPENFDMTDVNILAELYMQLGSFTETHALIARARQAIKQLQQEETGGEPAQDAQEEALPIDLAVKDGLCLAHLGRLEEADAMLAGLRADEEVTSLYPDLTLDVGCALATMGQHARALDYLCRLLVVPEFGSDQALWARLLTCHRALGNMEPMLTLYKSRLEEMAKDDLSYLETATTLAELYIECGRTEEALAFMPKLDESILKLQQGAAANAAAAAATSRSLDEQHKQACAQAEAEGKAGPDNKVVAMAAGAAAAAAAAAEEAERAAVTPAPTALLMRKNKLHLVLDQRPQFIQAVLPMVQDALESLAADIAAMKNPRLPRELARAISRRRMLESKGQGASRANLLEGEESTVFQGKPVRKDRRKAHVREADEMADAYFAGLGLADAGNESAAGSTSAAAAGLQGDGSGGRSELQRAVSRFRIHRAAALRALFTDEEGLHTFTELLSALVAEGRAPEAADLSKRAMVLCAGQSRWFPRARRDVVALILVDLLLMMGLPQEAVMHVKAVLGRWPASCRVWSRFSRAIAALGPLGTRSWSFVINSARRRCPESVPAMIMQGHAHAFHGKFNEAFLEYFQAYRFWPDEPLLLLSIGVAFIRLACSEKVADRNRAVLQGFAFLQAYSHQRGSKLLHESLYNIGRAAHALGLAGIAHHYYITSLTSSRPSLDANQEAESPGVDAMQLRGTAHTQHPHQQQQQQQLQHRHLGQGSATPGTDVEMAEAGGVVEHTVDAGLASADAAGPHSGQTEPAQPPHSHASSRGSGGTQAAAAAAAPAPAAAASCGGSGGTPAAAAAAAVTHQGLGGMQATSVAVAHQAGISGSGCTPEPGSTGGGQHRQPPGLWRRSKMRYTVTAGQGVARGMGPGEGGGTALGVGNMLDDVPSSLDLSQETAHNLAIMYRASGATTLVHRLYRRFLTIT